MTRQQKALQAATEYPVIDGFALSTALRCNLTFRSMVLAEFEALRRAGAYRNRTWVVPEDTNIAVPPYDSLERQIQVEPGSALWGYTFTGSASAFGILAFQIVDACSDYALSSEVVCLNDQTPLSAQKAFAKLLVVGAPGLLNVTITSTFGFDETGVQLILYGGEPMCRPKMKGE